MYYVHKIPAVTSNSYELFILPTFFCMQPLSLVVLNPPVSGTININILTLIHTCIQIIYPTTYIHTHNTRKIYKKGYVACRYKERMDFRVIMYITEIYFFT